MVIDGDGTGTGQKGGAEAITGAQLAQGVGQSALNPVTNHHAGAQRKLGESLKCSVHLFILGLAKMRGRQR